MNHATIKEVLLKLKEAGFVSAVVHYDGSGDSGQVEHISVFRKDEPEEYYRLLPEGTENTWEAVRKIREERNAILEGISLSIAQTRSLWTQDKGFYELTAVEDKTLLYALEALAYEWLSETHGGWEIDEGSYGDVVLHVDQMMVTLDHNERITETVSSTHTFSFGGSGE
jgi:hypothetical protein